MLGENFARDMAEDAGGKGLGCRGSGGDREALIC